MDLSPSHLLATLVGSALGYIYFSYGRSQVDWPLVASGIALMTYGFFITSLLWLVLVGVAIAAAPFGCRTLLMTSHFPRSPSHAETVLAVAARDDPGDPGALDGE